MKKIINFKESRGVTSLIVILGIGFFVLAIALTLTGQIVVEIIRGRNTVSGSQSFYTAESATREGVYQYLNTTTYSGGNFSQIINNISTSSIPISVTSSWPYTTVIAEAKNNITFRKVKYRVNLFPEGSAFDYAIYTTGTISVNSNGVDVYGNIAGGSINLGNHAEAIHNSTTTATTPIPQLNIDSYANLSTCFATSVTAAKACIPNAPVSAIVYASTTNLIKDPGGNHTNLVGSIITKGDLELGGGTFTASTDTIPVIIVGGNLSIGAGTTINGIVYVKGSTSMGGGGPDININGTLISGGNVNLGGTSEVTFNAATVANWVKIYGLSTTTAVAPKILSWQEE